MTVVCSHCLVLKQQMSPMDDGIISHGLCREHELELLIAGELATPLELEELAALRAQHVELTVRVPAHVAARLRELCAAAASVGRGVDPIAAAGVALSREINRTEYESVPPAVYSSPVLAAFGAILLRAKLEYRELE